MRGISSGVKIRTQRDEELDTLHVYKINSPLFLGYNKKAARWKLISSTEGYMNHQETAGSNGYI